MTAYTQTDIDTLKRAIGLGVREVQRNGERVQYGSLSEMQRVLASMEAEVAGIDRRAASVIYPTTSRGL